MANHFFAWACLCLLAAAPLSNAEVTVYYQVPLGHLSGTSTATSATSEATTVLAAYNTTELTPPGIPDPKPPTELSLEIQASAASVNGLSIAQKGTFFGFSIEMSVANQLLGKNSSFVQVPFLNLMANLVERAGAVHVRVGGNTQEYAVFTDQQLDYGKMIEKEQTNTANPTETPGTRYTIDLFYLMSNISSLVNVKWYLGLPFNDTQNWRLQMAEYGQTILGDNLLALQAGNEPDLYADHGHRNESYSPTDYMNEVQSVITALNDDPNIEYKHNLLGPSIATGDWTPDVVWEAGFIDTLSSDLYALTVEHYPDNNCYAQYGIGAPKFAQEQFPNYLNHTSGQLLVSPYLDSSARALAAGKPFIMFETNTASCGGFPGLSNSYGAALWALDYGLQMAYSNFSGALLHVGGQNVYYNPFTAPPTNESTYRQWTIGSTFYSALIMTEILGNTNTSRVMDLQQPTDNANIYTPQYAIYENDQLARVVLFNYVTDSSGASDITATITVAGGTVPSEVSVKYLSAPSVSTIGNLTWAGQTFGGNYQTDGRFAGDLDIRKITCDTSANTCQIPVPAPGFALVFMTDSALEVKTAGGAQTYSTSAVTRSRNTATIDEAALATSNGMSGKVWSENGYGSSSWGSVPGRNGAQTTSPLTTFVIFVAIASSATFTFLFSC